MVGTADVDGLVHDHASHCVRWGAAAYSRPVAIVLLLRHGHSTANEQGVLAGWTPGVGLTERGRRRAARDVAGRLSSLTLARAVASPLQRCAETAALALADADTSPETDDRLGECHYGAWTGLHLAQAAKDDLWRVVQDDPAAATFPPHDVYRAESLLTMAQRVVGAVPRPRCRGRGGPRLGCRVVGREPRRPHQGGRRPGRGGRVGRPPARAR